MLPVIQSLWIGADLSNVEKLCVQSFLDNGHEFHLYTYAKIGGVPQGAVIKDANEILPENDIFQNRRGGVTAFADWFRFALLNKRGNFWVDMDIICLKPFSFDSDIVFGRGVMVMAFPKGHILAQSLEKAGRNHTEIFPWEDATTIKKKRWKRLLRRGKEGMEFDNPLSLGGFTKALKYFSVNQHAKPFMYFTPIPHTQWHTAFNDAYAEGIGFYENTHAVHLWNEQARRISGFDKNARFDAESLFEQLKKKHGIENDENAPRIRSENIQSASLLERRKRKNKQRTKKIGVALALAAAFIAGWLGGR